ncbi:MAG: response regulator transcription factor [Sedimentisphaerales bacterium]|nr:response regulator transcription factor [Sedimentisphaerales bacterium]
MKKENKKYIYFVDDEPTVRKVISETLEQLDVKVTCFAGGPECLEQIESQGCDMLITDLKMPGMDGLELMRKAKELAPWLPVLVITAYGDIPLAVKTVKSGAADFIEKPLEKETFLRKVHTILQNNPHIKKYPSKPLTKSESQILKYLIDGKNNREIAESLHRSVRTIEVHRYRIMQKFNVESIVDLIKKAAVLGLIEMPNNKKSQAQKRRKKNNK